MKNARSTYDLTAAARERYAEDLFDIGRVAAVIERRVTQGFRDLRLSHKYPFDLSRSQAARLLEDWLESHQYRYAWYPTPPLLDPLCSFYED